MNQRWPSGPLALPVASYVYQPTNTEPVNASMLMSAPCPAVVGSYHAPESPNGPGCTSGVPVSKQSVIGTAVPMIDCFETGTPDVQPGPYGLSGAWYDPTTAGQGALVSIDAFTGVVFVGWYTYEATGGASGPEGQRWFTAQGGYGVSGSPIELGLYSTTGGVFDTDGAAATQQVGTGTLNFDSCEHATLDYTFTTGDLAGTHGTLDLARLGQTPAECAR